MAGATRQQQRQVEALEAFVGLLSDVDEDSDREEFYGRLAEAMCRMSGMPRAMVYRYDPARRRVEAAGSHGITLEPFLGVPVTMESADMALKALIDDRVIERSPPFEGYVPDAFLALANEGPVVCVPMCAAGRMIGLIIGQRRPEDPPLSDETAHWLWTLGKVAALAATARIATFEQQRARTLEDRIDLARDIHDRVVQRLFGVSLALAASTEPLAPQERERCENEIHTALADLREAVERPLGRIPRDTRATLREEVERLVAHPDLDVRVTGDPGAVPQALEALAQAVFTEATANALKHAKPSTIEVAVADDDGTFSLAVANDGVGSTRRRRRGVMGIGLRLAAFSALQAGGLVEFGPRGEGWWQVKLVVPDSGWETA